MRPVPSAIEGAGTAKRPGSLSGCMDEEDGHDREADHEARPDGAETTAPDPDDVRREIERLGESAESLREHAEDLLDHLEKWETGEVEAERRADSRAELFESLDKWETSHDREGSGRDGEDDGDGSGRDDGDGSGRDGSGRTDAGDE